MHLPLLKTKDYMKVIITGSTGMVGKGVLLECLGESTIENILVINRSSVGITHPKLKEILLPDFSDLRPITDDVKGFDAMFHCMGVSSMGMDEQKYTKFTYDITKGFADVLFEKNPEMVFIYVSGQGTDETEKSGMMWARVKGRTENYVLNKGFKDAYAFRPGAIIPEKGVKSRTGWINILLIMMKPFFPMMRKMKSITSTVRIGRAMINVTKNPISNKFVDNQDINRIAK